MGRFEKGGKFEEATRWDRRVLGPWLRLTLQWAGFTALTHLVCGAGVLRDRHRSVPFSAMGGARTESLRNSITALVSEHANELPVQDICVAGGPTGLQHFDDCIVDGNVRPWLGSDDSEELMYVLHGVAIALGSWPLESPGSLYVTTRRVIWLSDADRGKGYAVDFLSLSLHAVLRGREAYPFPCIYTQIETGDEDDEEESKASYSEINGDLVLSKITEMRLVPSDAGKYFDCLLIKSSQRDHRNWKAIL
ncbi:hypothetical protein ZIOFF_005572 [Zingiber officinale]|uniref:Chloride conductance regulatory protein ICln n=1 Tax=Zingiber officinale TaxID=94328 RepID=A0A8J5HUE0_ZINOF|nr:hypothetical protein ZIOFF_005572 [Zingiber officinale]